METGGGGGGSGGRGSGRGSGGGGSGRGSGRGSSGGGKMERIRAGDYVVLVPESGGGHTSVVQVTKNGSVRMGKKHWKLKHLIGCRFGSRFEGGGKEGVLIEKRLEIQKSDGEDKDVGGDAKKDGAKGELNTSRIDDMKARASFVESGDLEPRDNRSLHDDNTAQKLGQSAINGMKLNKKLSGQDIVDALVKNSSTYQTKTAFSQEKYRYVSRLWTIKNSALVV